ncbi:YitT family protein [Paenibacillus sp. FSL W8-0186]|uniref:Membrane protein n=1 Tax=Paenibacillus woosongensis TaxID=307580 RepID=A0ABQ4MYV0_9BACL|nr:YitT family protein [Paenibacillus woosongensis]GIP61082.1 membrane protein [Paenibacillus woosongensis]
MIIKVLSKMVSITFGLMILAMGVVMYLKSGLGVDSFTVFCEGLSKTLGVSIGSALQIFLMLLVLVVFFIDRSRLGIGTIMHALLVGFFIDLLLRLNIPSPQNIIISFIVLLMGILCVGSGLAIYIRAGMGAGAVDAIMMIVYKKLNINLKWAKLGIDSVLAGTGFLMGGSLGIGTVLGVLLTGTIVETILKLLNSAQPSSRGNNALL